MVVTKNIRFINGKFGQSILLGASGYPLKYYLMNLLENIPADELYNIGATTSHHGQ